MKVLNLSKNNYLSMKADKPWIITFQTDKNNDFNEKFNRKTDLPFSYTQLHYRYSLIVYLKSFVYLYLFMEMSTYF